MNFFDSYWNHIISLDYKVIKVNEGVESIKEMIENGCQFIITKFNIKKDEIFTIPRDHVDMIIGIYSENEGEYSLHTDENIIFEGKLIKNSLMYLQNLIPNCCLLYEKLYIKATCDISLLTSIFYPEPRMYFTSRKWKIHDDLYIYKGKTQRNYVKTCFFIDDMMQLPYLPNFSLISKIENMNNEEVINKFPEMRITDKEKKIILDDLDLLTLYISKKKIK